MGQIHNEAQTIGINVRRALFINHESEFGFDTDGQVRTLRDFDEDKLEITHSNGASVEPHYVPPNTSDVSDSTESAKCYRGSCHCGKITYDVQSKPLEEVGVLKCNCSICSRVCLPSPTVNPIPWLMTATERRPVDLPLGKGRRAPRRRPPHRLPIRAQSKRARVLFDMWRLGCEQFRAPRR